MLFAEGFSQIPHVRNKETYIPIKNAITFWYLINLTIHESLEIHIIDLILVYLYGSLDNETYIKIQRQLKMHEAYSLKSWEIYSIGLQRSLYNLR